MRLIDADEFRDDICRQTEFIQVDDFQVIPVVDVVNCLFNAPTVKAIPIEWIWKWYDEETHRLGDGWTHVEHPYSMERMIEDWEKENEKDI